MPVDERAKMGIGMMMQRPPNIFGVKLGDLVRAASANPQIIEKAETEAEKLQAALNEKFSTWQANEERQKMVNAINEQILPLKGWVPTTNQTTAQKILRSRKGA